MLEIEPLVSVTVRQLEVAETVTMSLPAPLQKHSPGSCTIDTPQSNCHRRTAYRFTAQYLASVRWLQIDLLSYLLTPHSSYPRCIADGLPRLMGAPSRRATPGINPATLDGRRRPATMFFAVGTDGRRSRRVAHGARWCEIDRRCRTATDICIHIPSRCRRRRHP